MKLLDPQSPSDWACILQEFSKLGKTKQNASLLSTQIFFPDFGEVGVTIHLPISDRNCMHKWVLCGSGRPFGKEYLDAYTDEMHHLRENWRHLSCAALHKDRKVANNKLRISREQCEGIVTPRRVICELSIKT
jgi:hypothetical protein